MSYELFIARRYLRSKKRTGFVSAITWISILSVALGVLALILVLGIVSGFEDEVRGRIAGTNAHLILLSYGDAGLKDTDRIEQEIGTIPGVLGMSPFTFGKALVSAGQQSDGVIVKGVDLAAERRVTTVADHLEPPLDRIPPPDAQGRPGIILGRHIADRLRVGVGDEILMASPFGGRATALGVVPILRRFRVASVFNSGLYEFDSSFAYVSLAEGQRFFGMDSTVTGIQIKIRDMFAAPEYKTKVLERLGGYPYRINTWIELNENLFVWMKWEKIGMTILLMLIVMVGALNIISALIMVVMEKRREIGVLKSMGATRGSVMRIFMLEGLFIGLVGTVSGSLLGYPLAFILDRYKLISIPGDVYFIETLPMKINVSDGLIITGSALLLTLLATLYPSWKAASLDPVQAIRNE